MSTMPGNDTTAAAERFFPGAVISPVGEREWLVSATTNEGVFSVRQIDPRLPAVRVELIREYLGRPELERATPLVASDGPTDARRWADGENLASVIAGSDWRTLHLPGSVATDTLGEVAASLGALHASGTTESLVARTPRYKAKDALTGVRRSLESDERVLAGEIRKESRARRWLTASRPLLAHAETNLDQVGFLRDEPAVMAHLDLWGSHAVLGEGGGASFLDFGTLGAAPAVVDLAQLIARNGEWSDERVERAINGYADSYPLQPLQRRVLPWLVALDAITSCGHLLVRAHDERLPLSDRDRRTVLAGADQQLDLLTKLASAFVPVAPRPYRRQGRRPSR